MWVDVWKVYSEKLGKRNGAQIIYKRARPILVHSGMQLHSNNSKMTIPTTIRSLLSLLRSILLRSDSGEGNISKHSQALFETTKRLLAEVVNEGLVDATIGGSKNDQCLYLNSRLQATENDRKWVKVGLQPGTVLETRDGKVACVVRPDSLQPPVVVGNGDGEEEDLDPGAFFKFLSPWLVEDADEEILNEIALELGNSARNQGKPHPPYTQTTYTNKKQKHGSTSVQPRKS